MNKMLDDGQKQSGETSDVDEEEDEDENMDEVPAVPQDVNETILATREDADSDDEIQEESKDNSNNLKMVPEIEQKPVEPFRLDELRISAPILRNELSDSTAFFLKLLN